VNGNADHDNVAYGKQVLVAVGVNTGIVIGATVGCEDLQNFARECRLGLGETEVIVNMFDTSIDGRWCWCKSNVHGKLEFAAKCCNAAQDIGAIDGAAVPGVGGALSHFGEYGVAGNSAIVGSNSDGFVENAKKAFDAQGFVVAAGDRVKANSQGLAHFFEFFEEFAVGVNHNETAEADFQKHFLHKQLSKGGGVGVLYVGAENEASQVAHGGEQVG